MRVEGDQLIPGWELVKVLGMSGNLEHQPAGGAGELDVGGVCVCVCVYERERQIQRSGRDYRIFQLNS